jgi:hypothetical protein
VRALTGDAGLLAATRHEQEAPVWVVTGTDEAGVKLAASALGSSRLGHRFAVAVLPGQTLALPLVGP